MKQRSPKASPPVKRQPWLRASLTARSEVLIVAVRFGLWVAAASLLTMLPAWRWLLGEEVLWTARVAFELLRAFGAEVSISGSSLSRGVVEILEVYPGCSGAVYCSFLAAAMLAFPTTWAKRLAGVILGSVALLIMNVARIVCLFLLGTVNPGLFVSIHEVAWPVFSIVATVALVGAWLAWVCAGKETTWQRG